MAEEPQEPDVLSLLFPHLREPSWGPFPLEGFSVFTDVMAGVVRVPVRFNGQRVVIEMHPDHAAMLGRAMIDAAVMQWQAWNLTTREKQ